MPSTRFTPRREDQADRSKDLEFMTAWLVIAVPLVMMLFPLIMERVENRLRHVAVQEEEIEEFLEQARPNEVGALYGHGIGRALELFRRRRRGGIKPAKVRSKKGAQLGSTFE